MTGPDGLIHTADDMANHADHLYQPDAANLTKSNRGTGDPGIKLPLTTDGARGGEPWSAVIHQGHGIFAHVEHVPGTPFVNVEYTLYYAYNEGGDTHDGDVISIDLVYDSKADLIERVGYSDHGCYYQVLELADDKAKSYGVLDGTAEDESTHTKTEVARIDGLNRGTINSGCVPSKGDPHVFLARDDNTGRFEHVAVFAEHGSHEPWPNGSGWVSANPNHNGYGVSFVPDVITFLGSFTTPTPGQEPFVYYNGKLGIDGQAVALHKTWYWPNGRAQQPYAPDSRFADPDPYQNIDSVPWPPMSHPARTFYVAQRSPGNDARASTGGSSDPISGLNLAYSFAPRDSTLLLAPGAYSEPLTMDRRMTLRSH